jgi:eukaryotic-like serine/threonine-protein kinase
MSQYSSVAEAEPELIRHCSTCLAIYRSEFTRCPVDGSHIVSSSKDPMLGVSVAEHYLVDELIGIGSSGRVYLAHHSRLAQRRFALKVLFGDLAATASARMRFSHEAESASRLAHPNLVSVVDFGRTPAGLMYLAMDYIEGPTLAKVIAREGAMPQERAVRISLQLCRGLAHAHDLGLIHRDFKPDNILVGSDVHGDVPRIVDFGIALSADTDGDPRLTATGITLGTPAYAAPEQTADGDVDHRADLFALGVTMYEMLTGSLPFDGGLVDMMRLNATTDAPPMAERAPGVHVTPALQQLVAKLMARNAAQRYQSAREALDALAALPRRSGAATRPSTTTMPVPANTGSYSTPSRAFPRQPTSPVVQSAAVSDARPSSPALTGRPSSPALAGRPSSPALAGRPSSPVLTGRPSSPVLAGRPSSPVLAGRPSSPVLAGRPSSSVISPMMVLPSSGPTRMPTAPVMESAETSARVRRIELAPLITPVPRQSPRFLTIALAVVIAAAASAAAVVGYQRMTAEKPAPPPTLAPVAPVAPPIAPAVDPAGERTIAPAAIEEKPPREKARPGSGAPIKPSQATTVVRQSGNHRAPSKLSR